MKSSLVVASLLILLFVSINDYTSVYAQSTHEESGSKMERRARIKRAGCVIKCLQFTPELEKCRKLCGLK
uniref:Kappa-KTx-like peptide k-KTxpcavC10 n=1 Tax=Pandinus cavimanus TaxID=217261 RepID=H2CYR9_PANCV|nr:kappa-KTx-like peptide k-KTxpcavC10 [Pandinus cavimanus]